MAAPADEIRFPHVHMKISNARDHLVRLEQAVAAYFAAKPVEIEKVGDPVNATGAYRVKSMKPLPDALALATGDVAHNLRSALDYLATSAAPSAGRTDVQFPVDRSGRHRTPKEWRGHVRGHLPGARPEFLRAVYQLDPREGGGDEWLWALHVLDVADKHQVLPAVGAKSAFIYDPIERLKRAFPDQAWIQEKTSTIKLPFAKVDWDPVYPGMTLMEMSEPWGSEMEFQFGVALQSPSPLRSRHLLETMVELTTKTADLVRLLEPLA